MTIFHHISIANRRTRPRNEGGLLYFRLMNIKAGYYSYQLPYFPIVIVKITILFQGVTNVS